MHASSRIQELAIATNNTRINKKPNRLSKYKDDQQTKQPSPKNLTPQQGPKQASSARLMTGLPSTDRLSAKSASTSRHMLDSVVSRGACTLTPREPPPIPTPTTSNQQERPMALIRGSLPLNRQHAQVPPA